MEHNALIEQLKQWHDNAEYEKVVAAVLALPEERLNTEIMYALVAAYVELGESKNAIAVLEGLRKTEENTYIWNFRMGMALVVTAETDSECQDDETLRINILKRARICLARGMNLNPPEEMLASAADYVEKIETELGYYDDADEDEIDESIELYSLEEIECLEEHIEKYFGETPTVFHEITSEDIHVDVYIAPPSKERNFYTLITLGMGAREMNTPDDVSKKRCELLICLPPDWKVGEEEPEWYWPIGLIKGLAHMPIECDTWLGWGHTIDNGGDLAPNVKMCGSLLVYPEDVKDGADECTLPNGETVSFYEVIPLYQEEMDYKIDNDTMGLLKQMTDVSHILAPDRPNVCEDYISNSERFDNLRRHSRKIISKGLPVEPIDGCNHIAIFIRWCITHHLLEEGFYTHCAEFAQAVFERQVLDLRPFFIEALGGALDIDQFSFVGANFLLYYYSGYEDRPYYPADVDDYAEKFFGTERYNSEEFQDEAYLFVPYDETYYKGMEEYIEKAFNEFLPIFMNTFSENAQDSISEIQELFDLEAEIIPNQYGYYGDYIVPKTADGSRSKSVVIVHKKADEEDYGYLFNALNPMLNDVLAVEFPSDNPIEWLDLHLERIDDADFGECKDLYTTCAERLEQNPLLIEICEDKRFLIIRDDSGVNRRYICETTGD